MTTGIDGLVSSLDTTSLINSLIQAEAGQQTLLKQQASDTTSFVSALRGLNSQVASVATLAAAAAKPAAFDLYTASSSSSTVTATAGTGSTTGSIDLVVNQLAQSQSNVSAALTAWPTDPAALTIVSGGKSTDITPVSNSLDDIVSAINKSGAGVSAMKVAAGVDGSGTAQYRLQFTSTTTGAASAFSVYQGTSADVTAGTATDLLAQPGAATLRTAQDAQVTLWSGSPAAQTITSSTNTFSNLLPNVAVTVSAVAATPVTVTVARDAGATSKVASDLVASLNTVFATISTKSAVVNSTGPDGSSRVSGGIFSGDSATSSINQALLSAASSPVNGVSPSEIGVSITKDGTLTFDNDKFTAALASDPAKVQSMMLEISSRVSAAASAVSDQYSGSLTTKITSQQGVIDSLGTQISDWDARLATKRASLEQTYAAMEVQLNNIKSQGTNFASQLSNLPSWPTS
ncbi:flagellar filament capping protein FliD [Parafrigoribacterium soli]|uniref:flagellar filament capping protein FliD n=1 Tax=Parafrigoribacterium soli TaxID=3144663 RepID=UPI0032EC7168